MKKFGVLFTVLVMFATYSQSAQSCSVVPIDVDKQVEDLSRYVPVALQLESAAIKSIDAKDASADYDWEGSTMCPRSMKAAATFVVGFDTNNPLESGCTGIVKVSKTKPLESGSLKKYEYRVEIVQEGICLQ